MFDKYISQIINEAWNISNELSYKIYANLGSVIERKLDDLRIRYGISDDIIFEIRRLINGNNDFRNQIYNAIVNFFHALFLYGVILPLYVSYLLLFEFVYLIHYLYGIITITLTELTYHNINNIDKFQNLLSSAKIKNTKDIFDIYVRLKKTNIDYALFLHINAIRWLYGILSVLEITDLHLETPAPGEWSNITETNDKYVVKYMNKILKLPIITYNDHNNKVIYALPFTKGAIKTDLQTVIKFIESMSE